MLERKVSRKSELEPLESPEDSLKVLRIGISVEQTKVEKRARAACSCKSPRLARDPSSPSVRILRFFSPCSGKREWKRTEGRESTAHGSIDSGGKGGRRSSPA